MSEEKMKYLEMIQGIISRLASNSFALKGWAVTILTGLFVLSAKDSNSTFFVLGYVPIFVFWYLDSYYLQLERKYIALYNHELNSNPSIVTFSLSPPKSNRADKTYFYQSIGSRSELGFYFPTAVLLSIIILVMNSI